MSGDLVKDTNQQDRFIVQMLQSHVRQQQANNSTRVNVVESQDVIVDKDKLGNGIVNPSMVFPSLGMEKERGAPVIQNFNLKSFRDVVIGTTSSLQGETRSVRRFIKPQVGTEIRRG